jgi:hypothetical protein
MKGDLKHYNFNILKQKYQAFSNFIFNLIGSVPNYVRNDPVF